MQALIIGSLTIIVATSNPSQDNMKPEALRAIGRNVYTIYGIDREVKYYTKKLIPDEYKHYGGYLATFYAVTIDKKVKLQWTF